MTYIPKKTIEKYDHGEYEVEIQKEHYSGDKLPSYLATVYHEDAPFGVWMTTRNYAHEYEGFLGVLMPILGRLGAWNRLFTSNLESKRISGLKQKVESEINKRERAMSD